MKPAPWSVESFPDEAGFQARIAGVVDEWAARDFRRRSQAESACPDTGRPVRVWALEGEEIVSPYTGRRYRQGPTGYFGPKARDADGRIARFGGDPLKYDLPPATARLLRDPDDAEARAFIAIPGNLNQLYHFAAVNWARLLGLVGDRLDAAWHAAFSATVAAYREARHPSDGAREHARPPATPFDLVGEEGMLLGGNPADGGTENHKTQWRTSGLLFAQLLGPAAVISGYPAPEAERRIADRLDDFLRRLLLTGNGEYDSTTYYPHTLAGYLNLFDFSPSESTRRMAQATMDTLLAGYAIKLFNGTLIGAVKRGFSDGLDWTGGDRWCDAFAGARAARDLSGHTIGLPLATTRYRPNRAIYNLMHNITETPLTARMARPSYHMDRANVFQESFHRTSDFALGSVAMTALDNPNQQTVWSLGTRADDGRTIVIGGGQPAYPDPEGHRPHDQVVQHRNTLLLVTAPNSAAGGPLRTLSRATPARARLEAQPRAAEAWLFVPRHAPGLILRDDLALVDAGSAWVAVWSLGDTPFELAADPATPALARMFERYRVVVFPGQPAGFALEALPRRDWPDADAATAALRAGARVERDAFRATGQAAYRALAGHTLEIRHNSRGLRADGGVDGRAFDWAGWCGGGVIESTALTVGHGRLTLRAGDAAYTLRMGDDGPRWSEP